MKKILVFIMALTMATATTFAEEEKGKQGGEDRMAQMQKNLGLTDQQVAEIRKIRDEGGSREQILAVLTDHQIEIMKERRAKMKGKGRNGGRQAPAGEAQDSETTDSDT